MKVRLRNSNKNSDHDYVQVMDLPLVLLEGFTGKPPTPRSRPLSPKP